MQKTTYIPHSLIIRIGIAVDTSSMNASDKIVIETKEGNYTADTSFTTDANGITGNFTELPVTAEFNY